MENLPQTNCSIETLAGLFSLTSRRVFQLAEQGIVRKGGKGSYLLAASVQSYIKHLSAKLERGSGLADEKAALIRIKREREELALARDKGDVVDVDELMSSLQRFVADVAGLIDGMPEKYGAQLHAAPEQTGKTDILHGFVRELRETLGSYQFSPPPDEPKRKRRKAGDQ